MKRKGMERGRGKEKWNKEGKWIIFFVSEFECYPDFSLLHPQEYNKYNLVSPWHARAIFASKVCKTVEMSTQKNLSNFIIDAPQKQWCPMINPLQIGSFELTKTNRKERNPNRCRRAEPLRTSNSSTRFSVETHFTSNFAVSTFAA